MQLSAGRYRTTSIPVLRTRLPLPIDSGFSVIDLFGPPRDARYVRGVPLVNTTLERESHNDRSFFTSLPITPRRIPYLNDRRTCGTFLTAH
jgi:hypothetical protein